MRENLVPRWPGGKHAEVPHSGGGRAGGRNSRAAASIIRAVTVETGQNLLHYRIVDKLGEGGMGVVWRAVDTSLDREVAVKVLPGGLAADPERLARFEREAKVLASLNHPNIAAVYGLHEAEPGPVRFLAMELVPGEDLSERIERDNWVEQARELMEQRKARDPSH